MATSSHSPWLHSLPHYINVRVCVCPPGGVAMPSGQRARFAAVCNYETMQWLRMSSVRACVCVRETITHMGVCVCVYMLPFKQTTCAFMCACVCVRHSYLWNFSHWSQRPPLSLTLAPSAAALSIQCAAIVLRLNSKSISRCILQRQQRSCWLTETIHTHTHTHTHIRTYAWRESRTNNPSTLNYILIKTLFVAAFTE